MEIIRIPPQTIQIPQMSLKTAQTRPNWILADDSNAPDVIGDKLDSSDDSSVPDDEGEIPAPDEPYLPSLLSLPKL